MAAACEPAVCETDMAHAPEAIEGWRACSLFVPFESSRLRDQGAKNLHPGRGRSGDDVGCDLVFDEGDAVTQLQLALLQPLQPQQVGGRRLMQRIDRRVEIAVLLLQPG